MKQSFGRGCSVLYHSVLLYFILSMAISAFCLNLLLFCKHFALCFCLPIFLKIMPANLHIPDYKNIKIDNIHYKLYYVNYLRNVKLVELQPRTNNTKSFINTQCLLIIYYLYISYCFVTKEPKYISLVK